MLSLLVGNAAFRNIKREITKRTELPRSKKALYEMMQLRSYQEECISRKEAKKRGLGMYFTGNPCKRGHVAQHYVGGGCVICAHLLRNQNSEYNNARAKQYYNDNKEHCLNVRTDYRRRRNYGLTSKQFDQMLNDQWKCCACCSQPFGRKKPHIDHNHETGKVRALLCHACNVGIGQLGDNIERLHAAIRYLERHKS